MRRGSRLSCNKKSPMKFIEIFWSIYPNLSVLRTFALIVMCFKDVRAYCFCASLLRTQIHTPLHAWERALSTKINNDRADGHCYSFAWILRSWTFGDPYFSFQKQTLFTIISTLFKNEQKSMWEVKKISRFLSPGHRILPSCGCKGRETMVAKCELVL